MKESKNHRSLARAAALLLLGLLLVQPSPCEDAPLHARDIKGLFKDSSLPAGPVSIQPGALAKQCDQVLYYFEKYGQKDPQAVGPGIFSALGVGAADVKATLHFVRDTLAEDLRKGGPLRLEDPRFLKRHFRCLRWHPRPGHAGFPGCIRVTRYAVFIVPGRERRDDIYRYALYRLPDDEQGMSPAQAEKQKQQLSRFRYTRQQVMAGAYDKGGALPLVWLNRQGLLTALMQGTIAVRIGGGTTRYFNVDRDNGIPYDPSIENPSNQRRYWYFAEVKEPRGYGMDSESMIAIFPGAAFAGDVTGLGLGKLIAIKGEQIRLGILADTGGAFSPSLNQLDYFAGLLESRKQLESETSAVPEFTEAYILIKKRSRKAEK